MLTLHKHSSFQDTFSQKGKSQGSSFVSKSIHFFPTKFPYFSLRCPIWNLFIVIFFFFLLNVLYQQDRLAITAQLHWWYCEDEWGLRGVREADLAAAQGPLVHPNCRKSQPSRLTQVPSQHQPTGHWALCCCSRILIKIWFFMSALQYFASCLLHCVLCGLLAFVLLHSQTHKKQESLIPRFPNVFVCKSIGLVSQSYWLRTS